MKFHLPKIFFALLFVIGLGTAVLESTVHAQENLERALEIQARYIVRSAPVNSVVAIVNIQSDSSRLSDYIITRILDQVTILATSTNNRRNISFVDRNELDILRREINFQYSGEVSEETMIMIGRMIGARIVVTGSLADAGLHYSFNIRLLEVETSRSLGSNSINVLHDDQMNGFLPNSTVAQAQRRQAQQAQQERDRTTRNNQDRLGVFSNGFYIGYLGSIQTPIGISIGGISQRVSFFLDNEFGPPRYGDYDRSNLTYSGNNVIGNSNYTYQNEDTALIWHLIAGININLIQTLLWINLGAGFEYSQQFKLFSESGGNQVWVQNESDNWNLAVSAGLYVKIWYFYIQGKYKYVFDEEFDTDSYGLSHLSLGAGFVWRR